MKLRDSRVVDKVGGTLQVSALLTRATNPLQPKVDRDDNYTRLFVCSALAAWLPFAATTTTTANGLVDDDARGGHIARQHSQSS